MLEPQDKGLNMGLTSSKDSSISPTCKLISEVSKNNVESEFINKNSVDSSVDTQSKSVNEEPGKGESVESKSDTIDEISPVVNDCSPKPEMKPGCTEIEETPEVKSSTGTTDIHSDQVKSILCDSVDSPDKVDLSDNVNSSVGDSVFPSDEKDIQSEVDKQLVITEPEKEVKVSSDKESKENEVAVSSVIEKNNLTSFKEGKDSKSSLHLDEEEKIDAKPSEDTAVMENGVNSSLVDEKFNDSEHMIDVDLSVRSRYGRAHKPKPLIDGFLTTDRKVGAFLGHSPQNSPRKKNDALRLSLKSIKKASPPKINPEEAVIAILKSLQSEKDGVSPTLETKTVRPRGRPRKRQRSWLLKKDIKTESPQIADPSVNGIFSPCIKKLFPDISNTLIKKRASRTSKSLEPSKSLGSPRTRSTDSKTENKEDEVKEVKDMTAVVENIDKDDDKKETEKVDEMEAIAEKESDSGVESSATTPTSEPEDGVMTKEEEKQAEAVTITEPQAEWLVGDLVWGHIKGHPFWPCIVVHEPEQGIYMKIKKAGRAPFALFHVRFFGDNARRSWISYRQIIRFNSAEDYLKLMEEFPLRKKDFEVSPKNIPKWKFAIQEAEKLAPLSRADRLETFTNMYPNVLKDEEEEILNKSLVVTPKITPKRGRKRRYPSSSPSSSDNETPNKSFIPKEKRPKKNYQAKRKKIKKSLTAYEAFSAKFRERVVDEHPDLNPEEIEKVLLQRWEMLEDTVKAGYDVRSNEGSTDGIKSSDEDDEVTGEVESEASSVGKAEGKSKAEKRKKPRKSLATKENLGSKQGGLFKGLRMDKVCIQCEQPGGELFKCKSSCLRFFHSKCTPAKSKGMDGSEDFKCGDCVVDGKPPCTACWKEEGVGKKEDERKKCNQHGCGRFYHEECLANWPQAWWSRHTFTCPAHCCHTCASDDPRESRMHTSHTEKLVRCIRCPATYHSGDFCLPAGCIVLTGSQILCQRHYEIPKKGFHHSNTSWCFICSKGGYLICCDRCPSSFHPQCLNITAPEGSYICEDCDSARYPLYGEVVWVKLGRAIRVRLVTSEGFLPLNRYRWWPAQILYPREVPDNVQQLPHSLGEFPVRFFGSHDHYWVNNGRAFLYQQGDSAKTAPPKSGTDALFARALQEAAVYYEKRAKEKAEWEAANVAGRNNCLKPPQFVRIKTNKPVGDVRPFEVLHGDTPCDCDPQTEKPCSQEPNCLNRMLMVECDPNVCRAGERCCNQRFQKRQYPPLATCRTEGRGWGLKTLADISHGDFVIEYVGEMINEAECHRRIERMHRLKDENYYFLTIDKDHILDAGPKGNLSRFMNHSCNPNCETQKWTVGGETRVGLFALSDIPAGTELTFNYNLQVIGTERRPCLCGAPNCIRFIGAKTKSEQEESNSNGSNAPEVPAKKRKWKRKKLGGSSKLLNQVCQKCSHGGELITCTIKTCGKLFHLSCVQLTEEPTGKWTCPLHQCAQCNGKPDFNCSECSLSFCCGHVALDVVGKTSINCAEHVKQEAKENGLEKEIDVEEVEKPKETVSEKGKEEEKEKGDDDVKDKDSKAKVNPPEEKAQTPRQRAIQRNKLARQSES